jgi:hypothetical protein
MSDWRLTAESSIYKEALKATKSIEEPAYGFTKPSDITRNTTSAIIKQNNTIIQLLVKLREDLEDCKVAIRRIEAAKARASEPEDLTVSIQELQKDLQKLNLGEPSEKKIRKPTDNLFIFKNPKHIFDSVKNKK